MTLGYCGCGNAAQNMSLVKALTFGVVLALCSAPALAEDFTVPITSDFNVDDLTWSGGFGKAYDVRWVALLVDGKVAVCGAGVFLDPTTRSATVDLLRKASVKVDGKVMMKDLSYFAKYRKGQNLDKVTANCRSTGVAPERRDSRIELEFSGRARF